MKITKKLQYSNWKINLQEFYIILRDFICVFDCLKLQKSIFVLAKHILNTFFEHSNIEII